MKFLRLETFTLTSKTTALMVHGRGFAHWTKRAQTPQSMLLRSGESGLVFVASEMGFCPHRFTNFKSTQFSYLTVSIVSTICSSFSIFTSSALRILALDVAGNDGSLPSKIASICSSERFFVSTYYAMSVTIAQERLSGNLRRT